MENSSGFWKWIGAAALVVILGVGLGYYVSTPQKAANDTTATPTQDATPPRTTVVAPGAHPPPPIGQYIAKGAPEIQILEQAPSATKAKPPTIKPVVPTPVKPTTTTSTPADQTTLPTEPATPLAPSPATDPNAPAPPAPVAPTLPTPDPQPAPPAPAQPVAQTPPPPVDNSPVYHVLVGTTFSSEKNARIFAADLRHRGFMAMTASVSSDTGVVYKVQVGAYHNRLSAEEAASQLQQSGYPAYIATDR